MGLPSKKSWSFFYNYYRTNIEQSTRHKSINGVTWECSHLLQIECIFSAFYLFLLFSCFPVYLCNYCIVDFKIVCKINLIGLAMVWTGKLLQISFVNLIYYHVINYQERLLQIASLLSYAKYLTRVKFLKSILLKYK